MVAKSSKQSTPVEKFDDWLKGTATIITGPSWKNLPKEALAEIDKVLAHNDTNPSKAVPQAALLNRIRTVYKVKFTRAALEHYLHTVLGRNWRD